MSDTTTATFIGPVGDGRGLETELLMVALVADADASPELSDAMRLIGDCPVDYLAPETIRSLITVGGTAAGMAAWVDWQGLAEELRAQSLDVEPRIAAAWAVAAYLAVGMPIAIERAVGDLDGLTAMVWVDIDEDRRRRNLNVTTGLEVLR